MSTHTTGESQTLHFQVNASALALPDADGHRQVRNSGRDDSGGGGGGGGDNDGGYGIVFSRGHGQDLVAQLHVAGEWPRLETKLRWW